MTRQDTLQYSGRDVRVRVLLQTNSRQLFDLGCCATQSVRKFWPTTRRVDNVYGDRNLIVTLNEEKSAEKIAAFA